MSYSKICQVSISHLIFQLSTFFIDISTKGHHVPHPFISLTVIHTLLLLLSFHNPHTCLCISNEENWPDLSTCPQEVSQKHGTTQRLDFEGHYIKKWIPWLCPAKICSHRFLQQLNPSNTQELCDQSHSWHLCSSIFYSCQHLLH